MTEKLSYKFLNHEEAALRLLDILPIKQMQEEDWLILGLSVESVMMLERIAKKTGLYYDFLFNEKIFSPNNPDCLIAAVSESEEIVIQEALRDSFDIKLDYIYGEAHRKYEEVILKKIYKYRKGVDACRFKNRSILLLDEGCESGLRALCAVKTVIKEEAKSVAFATPFIAQDTFSFLDMSIDEIFTVYQIADFVETPFYYQDEQKLNSDVILAILENSKNYLPFQKKQGEE
ncbi:MAG: sodium:proton antiporter [Campylobacteraceae bacterium]